LDRAQADVGRSDRGADLGVLAGGRIGVAGGAAGGARGRAVADADRVGSTLVAVRAGLALGPRVDGHPGAGARGGGARHVVAGDAAVGDAARVVLQAALAAARLAVAF